MSVVVKVREFVVNFLAAVWNKISDEPAVTVALVIAAINTATEQSVKGYLYAVAAALFRFAVSPALPRIEK